MGPYICILHTGTEEHLSGTAMSSASARVRMELTKYGFRYVDRDVHADVSARAEVRMSALDGCVGVLALVSAAAWADEALVQQLALVRKSQLPLVCVSLDGCGAEAAEWAFPEGEAPECITYPLGEAPDPRTMVYYVHRLYVGILCRLRACFSATLCVDDAIGRVVRWAVEAYAGQAEAQWMLALAYECGEGAPMLEDQAAYWMQRAAEAGLVDAMIRLGQYKVDGRGTPRDLPGALTLFENAAAAGDVRGVYHSAVCALYGYGMMRDEERAIALLRQAAKAGYVEARYRLGLLYRDGREALQEASASAGTDRRRAWCAAVRHLYIACAELTGSVGDAAGQDGASCTQTLPLFGRRPAYMQGTARRYHRLRMSRMCALYLSRHLVSGGRTVGSAGGLGAACLQRNHYRRHQVWEQTFLDMPPAPARDVARGNRERGYSEQVWDVSLAAAALGRLLELGCPEAGIPPRPLQALCWYRRAMARGDSGAMYRLGECYRCGRGVPPDPQTAVALYRRAAELGSDQGQFALGVCYETGCGVAQDAAMAFACYQMAAARGYAPAQNNVGGCYAHGYGVAQDMSMAVEWYMKAAAAGQSDAACRLGVCYENGWGVEKDMERALDLYQQAVAQGHAYAHYRLGFCYDRGVGVTVPQAEIVSLYRYAATRGVADAAYALALCYQQGRGVRRNGAEAYTWFCEAAGAGSVQGAWEAGHCLWEGHDTMRDAPAALTYFAHAARLWRSHQGSAVAYAWYQTVPVGGITPREAAGSALYMAGFCTLYGLAGSECTPTSALRARALFEEAAEAGYVAACTAVGDMYTYGLLSTKHEREDSWTTQMAHRWYLRAAQAQPEDLLQAFARRAKAEACLSLAGAQALVSLCTGPDTATEELPAETWHSLVEAAREGQAGALVTLASYVFFGRGRVQNKPMALRLLRRAEKTPDGSPAAALFLGDLALCGTRQLAENPQEDIFAPPSYQIAAEAYLRALRPALGEGIRTAPSGGGHAAEYLLRERRAETRALRERARTQALYRVAVLSSVYPDLVDSVLSADAGVSGGDDRPSAAPVTALSETGAGEAGMAPASHTATGFDVSNMASVPTAMTPFVWLSRAILAGHKEAVEDLARMVAAYAPKGGGKGSESRRRDSVSPTEWMRAYYALVCPTTRPFSWCMVPRAEAVTMGAPVATEAPARTSEAAPAKTADTAPATLEVTPALRAAALNFLGDCFFFGREVPKDAAQAVCCYRLAAGTPSVKGAPVSSGVVWAQYSLGWCLLHGVGVPVNPEEGMAWLTRAAHFHGEAAFRLAECYEQGIGLDAPSTKDALKLYRKAEQLGYPAASKVRALEKRLRRELEEGI